MTAILLEHFHGAVTRVGPTATAVPHRERRLQPAAPLGVDGSGRHRGATSRGRRTRYAAFSEHFAGRRWLNYLGDDQRDDAISAAYGPNYDRLVDVKRRYDPENVFHLNHNIVP